MEKIKQFLHGLSQSHRSHHVAGGFLLGLFFGFLTVAVAACTLEFKDCQYDRWNAQYGVKRWKWRWKSWDWVDFFCTVAGGLLGGVLRWLAIGWFM